MTFGSGQGGRYNIFWTPADGSGKPEPLTDSQNPQLPTSWSLDGNVLLYHEVNSATKADIWQLSLGSGKAWPFIGNEFGEADAEFAPGGRWVAYSSNESGKVEVYVQPYPGPGAKIQISTAGGGLPRWNRNSRELFYRTATAVMASSDFRAAALGRHYR